jgi:LTXXQ motif family protein
MKRNTKFMLAGAALVIAGSGALAAYAMPGGPRHENFGPMGHICEARNPMGPRLIEHLQRTIKPTDAQKPEFEALKAALAKAEADVKATCPADPESVDRSPTGMLASMEQHLNAMLGAVKTVRPAFDALYAKLDDKQRDALRWSSPFMWEHHDHHHGMTPDDAPKPQ